jgi:hypothetical protein
MILATHGIVGSQIVQFVPDSDAQAFFDRVTTAGGTLSANEKNAVNTLVIQMKTDGIWTKIKAAYPMVGSSGASCAQNLKSSSFTGSFSTGWTFSSTGAFTQNGFMNTNITPSEMSQNSIHFGFYNRDSRTGTYKMGVYATTPIFKGCYLRGTNLTNDNLVNGGDDSALFQRSNGMVVANRTDGFDKMVFNNGIKSSRASVSLTPVDNFTFYLNGLNAAGSSSNATTAEYCFSTIGDGITDTEASNYYTAVQAFQTTLSRQV